MQVMKTVCLTKTIVSLRVLLPLLFIFQLVVSVAGQSLVNRLAQDSKAAAVAEDGWTPLFQAEGTEIFYRNIEIKPLPTNQDSTYKVLVFSKTTGFRHDSIPAGIAAIQELGAQNNFTVDVTEDAAAFNDTNLSQYRTIIFLSTTGDVLNTSQQAAFEHYIRAGNGYVGIHSASDTEYTWSWYGGLVGAYFSSHPEIQPARVRIENSTHPSTASLPNPWVRTDEWYNFQSNPRANVQVLANLDETSYTGGTMGDHPIAWFHSYDGGRAWYTGGGHTIESYSEPAFRQHILGGIQYAADAASVTPFDYDGDGKSDVSVFRPSNSAWYLLQSQNGFTGVTFGISTDRIVPADYDGDGKTDVAVYRNGIWYLQRSQLGFTGVSFGEATDTPMPADYDGDGKADIAVFRPSTGIWYLLRSQLGFTGVQFGQQGDKPVAADYDGDGKTDVAVYRNGIWYLNRSQLGFTAVFFGEANDTPVPADYDGDGKADIAVFRPSNGVWYLNQSQLGLTAIQFGTGGDFPVPADYDGDGRADVSIFRNGVWYLNRSQLGFTGIYFGAGADIPVPNAFVP